MNYLKGYLGNWIIILRIKMKKNIKKLETKS